MSTNRIELSTDQADYEAHRVNPEYVDIYKSPDIESSPTFMHPRSQSDTNVSGHVQWFRSRFGEDGEVFVMLCKGAEPDKISPEEFQCVMEILTENAAQIRTLLEINASKELRLNMALPGTYNKCSIVANDSGRIRYNRKQVEQKHVIAHFMGHKIESVPIGTPLDQISEAVRQAIDLALKNLKEPQQLDAAHGAAELSLQVQDV